MKRSRRLPILLALLVPALGGVAFYCWNHRETARTAARQAQADARICQQLVGRIQALEHGPSLAEARQIDPVELTARIDQVARGEDVQLPDRAVHEIDPQLPRRVRDTPYEEQLVHVELRNITLEQAVRFVHTLCSGQPGQAPLHARRIELASHDPRDTGRLWRARIAVGYLIYNPIDNGRKSQ